MASTAAGAPSAAGDEADLRARRTVRRRSLAAGQVEAGGAVARKMGRKAPGRSLVVGQVEAAGAADPTADRKARGRSLVMDLAEGGTAVDRRADPKAGPSAASIATFTADPARVAGLGVVPESSGVTSVRPSCSCWPTSRCTATTSCRR